MNCAFTENHYRDILRSFRSAGYRFVGYSEFVPGADRQVILRHDVDLSLEDALRIARIEAEIGVTTVFHVLLTADIYNPMSTAGRAILREIRGLGHRIGLHVDPVAIEKGDTAVPSFYQGLQDLFRLAREVLGPLDSYSIHRPGSNGKAGDLHPDRLSFPVPLYADTDVYRERTLYRSDSRREWRHGCICGQIVELQGRSLQLVIHPIWWSPGPQTRDEVLQKHMNDHMGLVDNYLAFNLSFYRRRHERNP